MSNHDQRADDATKRPQAHSASKAALEAKPDEARMSEIAKRLLATKPQRSAGKGSSAKQTAD